MVERSIKRWSGIGAAALMLAAALIPVRAQQPAPVAPQAPPVAGRGGGGLNDACGGRSQNPREACPNDVTRMIATLGLLPDKPRRQYVKRLKALQENLGEHQDAEVHIMLLRALLPELEAGGATADTMVALGQLTERLDQTRQTARAEFAEHFAAYDSAATQRSLDALLEAIAP